MPYHQNGTFMIGERYGVKGLPFLLKEPTDFETWCQTVIKSDLVRMLYARALPARVTPQCFDDIAMVVANMFRYRGSFGLLCDNVPNQNYIDYFRRAISLYVNHNPDIEFDTESDYNDFTSDVALSVISAHLVSIVEAVPSYATLRKLMIYSLLAGVIGLDMKCSHCAASALRHDNAAALLGGAASARDQDIYHWLQRKEHDAALYCPELFAWDAYKSLVLSRPCVLYFFPDDFGETFFDLFRLQAEMARNKELRVIFVPRNGRYHNDFALADIESTLSHPIFAALCRWRDQGRFEVNVHGPRSGSVEGPKMSRALVEKILEEADVLFFKGARTYELLATGIRVPSFSGQTVSREFSESVMGADAASGVPTLRHFCAFPDFWGFKERFRNTRPLFPTKKLGWQASMTAIDSSRFTTSRSFRTACRTRSVYSVAQEIMERAVETGLAPHCVDI